VSPFLLLLVSLSHLEPPHDRNADPPASCVPSPAVATEFKLLDDNLVSRSPVFGSQTYLPFMLFLTCLSLSSVLCFLPTYMSATNSFSLYLFFGHLVLVCPFPFRFYVFFLSHTSPSQMI